MKRMWLSAAAVLTIAASAGAQTKPRWRLDFQHEKPQLFTYRDPLDRLENFWYCVYTISNPTEETLPILVDLMIYTEAGKDLQHDARKIDPAPAAAAAENPQRSEALKFGRFSSNVVVPEAVEYKIIEFHARLGSISPGLARETIEAFKRGFERDPESPDTAGRWKAGDRMYLNASQMRRQRYIAPGQRLHSVAIFRNVDPRARILQLHVSGLWDVVRVDGYDPDTMQVSYENKVLKVVYDFRGDEFEREKDVLVPRGREWVVKPIGPIASKETLHTLVDTLLAQLRKEERWASGEVPAEQAEAERKAESLTPMDYAICARIFRLGTGQDFGYDANRTLFENRESVWRMHEWWVTNKSRLAFNEATGRFHLMDPTLPGQQKD